MLGDGIQDTLPPKMAPCPIDLKLEKLETTAEEVMSLLLLESVCLVTQLCPTLCNPFFDSSSPGSSVHGIFQARILE